MTPPIDGAFVWMTPARRRPRALVAVPREGELERLRARVAELEAEVARLRRKPTTLLDAVGGWLNGALAARLG